MKTGGILAIIYIYTAIGSGPAIHTYTRITAMGIRTCSTILAYGGPAINDERVLIKFKILKKRIKKAILYLKAHSSISTSQ